MFFKITNLKIGVIFKSIYVRNKCSTEMNLKSKQECYRKSFLFFRKTGPEFCASALLHSEFHFSEFRFSVHFIFSSINTDILFLFQFRKTLWSVCKRFVMNISCMNYYQLNWQIALRSILKISGDVLKVWRTRWKWWDNVMVFLEKQCIYLLS